MTHAVAYKSENVTQFIQVTGNLIYLCGCDPGLLREPRHGPGFGLGAVGELGEGVEDAGKVGVVVEVGRLGGGAIQ